MTDKMIHDFENIAEVFKQLGDPTRLHIFWILCHREVCVSQLAFLLKMSSPAISHHLRPLRHSGLIVSRREGKEVYYSMSDCNESRLLHTMIEQLSQITCPNGGTYEK